MTRQRKEIIKKVERVQLGMEMDDLMGCGLPPAVFEEREREIYSLWGQLAQLQHYACVEDMLYDTRGRENAGYL